MTTEADIFVCLEGDDAEAVLKLSAKAEAALKRSGKLLPGDRTEVVRFESLHTTIDQLAVKAMMASGGSFIKTDTPNPKRPVSCVLTPESKDKEGVPPKVCNWLNNGKTAVRLTLPHFSGEPPVSAGKGAICPPMERWEAPVETREVRKMLQKRFEYLIEKALDGDGEGAIQPSGIVNSVLTEGFRRYVQQDGTGPCDVPVVYRDGSKGPPFPLRSLNLTDDLPDANGWKELRFTLMSIRHVEMDGAWLRNVKISRPRSAGLTDEIVFNTSLRQFKMIKSSVDRAYIHLYQTGLESAVTGFYRALVHHLRENPGSVIIRPMYYRKKASYKEGTLWATR